MENRKAKQVLSGVGTTGRAWVVCKERCRGVWWKNYVHMYVNGKIKPGGTIIGMGEGGIKEND
jgi:hypothetical protein